MNRKGIVLSGLIYALLAFFLLLVIGLLAVLWYRQNAIDELSRDANAIYDDPYIPDDVDTFEFSYTGDYQAFVVPKTGKYKVELWGASGGGDLPGKGGYTSGEIYLEGANVIYLYVGQKGIKGATKTYPEQPNLSFATFNGGGAGGIAGGPYDTGTTIYNYLFGDSGGGATDLRLINDAWDNINSLKSRIMVAAGGAANNINDMPNGQGSAGGLTGYIGSTSSYFPDKGGLGGTQIGGYAFGVGGAGENGQLTGASGNGGCHGHNGGGGGYYGGFGGKTTGGSCYKIGGGGGSSFISGHPGCDAITEAGAHTGQPNHYSGYVFTNTQMIAGNELMPNPMGGVQTGHLGNGFARITYLP